MIERHCVRCAGRLTGTPATCIDCGHVHYRDPKVAACVIFRWEQGVFLMRRAIEPGYGRWTYPGGYVDRGETVEAAAIREAYEECGAHVRLDGLLGLYSYPGQTAIIVVYRGQVVSGTPSSVSESLEARPFREKEVPWGDLAFPSTVEGLRDFFESERGGPLGRSRNLSNP